MMGSQSRNSWTGSESKNSDGRKMLRSDSGVESRFIDCCALIPARPRVTRGTHPGSDETDPRGHAGRHAGLVRSSDEAELRHQREGACPKSDERPAQKAKGQQGWNVKHIIRSIISPMLRKLLRTRLGAR